MQIARRQPSAALASLHESLAIRGPLAAGRPDQVGYNRGLAQLCADIGDAALAAIGGARASESRVEEARRAYTQSLALWTQLDRRKVLWADERHKPGEIAQKLAAINASTGPHR